MAASRMRSCRRFLAGRRCCRGRSGTAGCSVRNEPNGPQARKRTSAGFCRAATGALPVLQGVYPMAVLRLLPLMLLLAIAACAGCSGKSFESDPQPYEPARADPDVPTRDSFERI